MTKKLLLILLLLLTHGVMPAQKDPETQKAIQTFNEGKRDKGIAMMQKVVDRTNAEEDWDLLAQMYHERFVFSKQNQTDVLVAQLTKALGGKKSKVKAYTSPSICLAEMITKCKEAGWKSESNYASMYLRIYLVDHPADTGVSKEAKEVFKEAEEYFTKKDYRKAKTRYLKAYGMHPGYYKAMIYAGDCYWYLEDLDSAIYCFREGIRLHPDLLEPRKYLVDALMDKRDGEKAIKECILGICVYPDESMFDKLRNAYKREGRSFNRHWIKRGCAPNEMFLKPAPVKDHWKFYQDAMNKLAPYCDSNGIVVKENSLTNGKFLEVYCWEEMLKQAGDVSELEFARTMQKEGMLAQYVFISQFHYAFYRQFIAWVNGNSSAVTNYFEKFVAGK